MAKQRADQRLLDQGLVDDLKKAQALIMSGQVLTTNQDKILTPGQQIKTDTELRLKQADHPYVSRGGLKLEKALELFKINLTDKVVVDIGSSTGGFTDVSLRNGARLVYAVDVGTNQLVWSLRSHNQVVVMEQTNFRDCTLEDFKHGRPEVAVIDVSFISLNIILKTLKDILLANQPVIALIKPQFEAHRDQVEAGGLISDPEVHRKILHHTTAFMNDLGYSVDNIAPSPITGGKGNIEFISKLTNQSSQGPDLDVLIDQAITVSQDIL